MSETRLGVTVVPGAARNGVSRQEDGSFKFRVAAPAREGKANRELLCYLALVLGVSKSAVSIERGGGSRHKVVSISGLDTTEVERRIDVVVAG